MSSLITPGLVILDEDLGADRAGVIRRLAELVTASVRASDTEALFARNFAGYDHIVTPSGSCAHHVRDQMTAIEQTPEVRAVRRNTRELVEFLHDVLQVREFPWAEFPHKVGLHIGCATLRGLREAATSEIVEPPFNKPARLLGAVKGLEFVRPERPDECCGFGGTFSLKNPDVSVAMGSDKARHAQETGAEVLCSADSSCLMHIGGLLSRQRSGMRVLHLAEILAATEGAQQ